MAAGWGRLWPWLLGRLGASTVVPAPPAPTHAPVVWARQSHAALWYREARTALWRRGEAGVSLDLQRFTPDAYLASRFAVEITGPENPTAITWAFLVGATEHSPPLLSLGVGTGIALAADKITVTISAAQVTALGTGGYYCELWDDTNAELVGRYFLPVRRPMRPPPA